MKKLFFVLLVMIAFNVNAQDNFTLTDVTGKKHQLSEYKGRWLIVNYWATWCPPCLEEIPDFVHLYDARKDKDLMVLGVAMQYQNAEEVTDFADDLLISYPVILGDAPETVHVGKVDVLPTTFIFNPQGKLVKSKRGLITRKQIEIIMQTKD